MNGEIKYSVVKCLRCGSGDNTYVRAFRYGQNGNKWLTWFCSTCDPYLEDGFELNETVYPLEQIVADIQYAREQADLAIAELPEDFRRWEAIFSLEDEGDAGDE